MDSAPLSPAAEAGRAPRAEPATRTEASEETSYLAHIETSPGINPVDLLREWKVVAASRGALMCDTMVLATVNSALEVSARTVVLRRIDGGGLVFLTDRRSRKAADLDDNPQASVVFAWNYRLGQRVVNRQVRAAGPVTMLDTTITGELYAREPLYCRLRSYLCHQGAPVDWATHAARHDELLTSHRTGKAPLDERPEHVVAYILQPDWLEFYHALDDCIADRVLFKRERGSSDWTMGHIAA